ncbi:MAG TPA: TusE/DsrC/DsvC family sulfur relay protein [Burkholderiaceae bacterium]|nr:TusE/DsrC/DsvC family sulfur relay protein [Burkholderiaceae bacterium]
MFPQSSVTQRPNVDIAPGWFDEDGFLSEPGNWTEALAQSLAREAGISELTAKHWEVIGYVRERYFSIGALPVMRLVCRAAGLDPNHAHGLFSSCKSLWRIAGLPNPGEEAKSYMN